MHVFGPQLAKGALQDTAIDDLVKIYLPSFDSNTPILVVVVTPREIYGLVLVMKNLI